ncbi:histidine kinase [Actinacidiphila sp. DG2A-62]|uniref:sensor histidine kinase n=1 Tax=Actinacidiphila sp. DG2A-62 TaxID=3108821 RepID=UPI002DB8CDC9|nr:histidine kinase [Actinacidiphila sp. DG2A-62]MEC3998732.1 histidine kinase [Actinacidiphila sp. DG2A-62]
MTYQEPAAPPRRRRGSAGRPVWLAPLLLAVLQVVGSSVAGRHQSQRVPLDGLGYALLLAGPALLLLRRRRPVLVTAGVGGATLLYVALGYPWGPVFASFVVAVFTAVAAGRRRAVFAVAAAVLAGHVAVGAWLYRWLPPAHDRAASWTTLSGGAAWLLAVLAAAELYRVRRERIARERRERAEAERRRADEERLRIARELHDVLAHSISLINVQAGVALALMDERPEQARTALTTIKAASKEALGEVRQVLGTLRAPGDAPRAPAPGLDRLSELTEQAAAAGLVVDVAVEGRRGPLPPGVDLAAFRIVQEALTNVVRHSGSRTARVRMRYDAGCVEVRVDDDGPAAAGGDGGGGNGLVGMRERAAALGGAVEAGPRADGGFAVRATLPFARPEPAPEGPGPEPEPVRAEPSPQPWQEPEPGRPEPGDTEERR